MERILTLEDVCALLKVSVQTGRNRLCRGDPMPPSFRTGRRRLFLESKVEAWILQQADVDARGPNMDEVSIPSRRRVGRIPISNEFSNQ